MFGLAKDNGKWCCETCRHENKVMRSTMIVCGICGNKRCPKAENHIFKCTSSNDLNQQGVIDDGK